jgi:hypothetical protein
MSNLRLQNTNDPRVKGAKYQPVPNATLFEVGPAGSPDQNQKIHPNDVEQNHIGDCYFMASMAAIAHNDPEAIEHMIQDNGDGTYTVTFYEEKSIFDFSGPDFKPVEVTVDADFPMKNSKSVFAGEGDGGHEIWPMIMEKAYAQYNGDYPSIEGGWPDEALQQLTGI